MSRTRTRINKDRAADASLSDGNAKTATQFARLLGLPVAAVPIPLSPLPIGVQIIGPYLEALTPIQFAQLLEQAYGGFVPPRL